MIRRPPRSTPLYSSAASDVYKRQGHSGRLRAGGWISQQSGEYTGELIRQHDCACIQDGQVVGAGDGYSSTHAQQGQLPHQPTLAIVRVNGLRKTAVIGWNGKTFRHSS